MNYSNPEYKYGGVSIVAFVFLGWVIIGASVFIGNPYTVSAMVLFISFFIAILSGKNPKPWIFLASILAANPVNFSAAFPSNLVLVFCILILNLQYLFYLPKWIYIATIFSVLAFIISSTNWISENVFLSTLQQTNHMINYLLIPIILLPVIYFRMGECKDNYVKLKGLLYYLIIPSTLILLLAYIFGTPIKNYNTEVIYHAMDIRVYKFINTEVDFTRTHSGFIFSSLICASTAILIFKVKFIYRLMAAICLAVNLLLLLSSGSVGSIIACFFGIGAMLYCASRRIGAIKFVTSTVMIICMLFSIWVISPSKIKDYIGLRYKERFVAKGLNVDDRIMLWKRAFNYSLEHPEGVGWSIFYVDKVKINAHNDYLLYAINYGIIAGIVYAYIILRLLIFFYRKSKTIIQDSPALSINLAGLGVVTVLLINSISDHLVANKWYFNVIWSILWYSYFCCHTSTNDLTRNEGNSP